MSDLPLRSEQNSPFLFENVDFDGILSCVHCGLCLEVCPTYRELGMEQDSPRGRLFLMRGLWQNELELNEDVIAPLSRCLDCRACESACPSNVRYGELLEKTRGIIQEKVSQSFKERLLRKVFLKHLLISTGLFAIGQRDHENLRQLGDTPAYYPQGPAQDTPPAPRQCAEHVATILGQFLQTEICRQRFSGTEPPPENSLSGGIFYGLHHGRFRSSHA